MVKVKFYGGAREVGNVRIAIEYDEHTFCLDYGVGNEGSEPSEALPKVDTIAVSHGHLDHIGTLHEAVRKNPQLEIFATENTSKIIRHQLDDMLKIEDYRVSKGKPRTLFLDDVLATSDRLRKSSYRERIDRYGFNFGFYNAGHIPGSAIISLKCGGKSIVFTGDINLEGNLHGEKPDLAGIEKDPDLLIMESTYGNTARGKTSEEEKKLLDYVEEALSRGRNVFIPAFAIERIQRIALLLSRIREKYASHRFYVVASPAYSDINRAVYREFDFSSLDEIAMLPKGYFSTPSIILSTSGFCTGGWSKQIFYDVIDRQNYTIILPSSFTPDNSPLKEALETGAATFKFGKKTKVKKLKAEMKRVQLSAHSDREGLLQIAESICPSKKSTIALVHGDPEAQEPLLAELRSRGYNAISPQKYEELYL